MEQVADKVQVFDGKPAYGVNVYLIDGVILDAGTRFSWRRIIRQARGLELTGHAVTHGHADHVGSSKRLCEELGIPFYAPDVEADGIAKAEIAGFVPDNLAARIHRRVFQGPGITATRRLKEGDEVAGFAAIDTPGHSPGHMSFWREEDGILIVGDALFHRSSSGKVVLIEAPEVWTVDPKQNRASIRKLAELDPSVICFGHGPPLRDMGEFRRLVDNLPA